MADKLTLKQERFAWEYTRNGGNASQAYRDVYSCNGSSDDTIAKRAHELRHDGKIAGRIDRLEREQQRVARLDRNSVLGMLLATYDKAVQCDQTGPAARCVELIGKAVGGGMFTDRHEVGQDVLSREQLIDQLSEGSDDCRKLAERLLDYPRSFEEGANAATKARFRPSGAG